MAQTNTPMDIEEVKQLFSDLWKEEYGVRPGLDRSEADMLRYIDERLEEPPSPSERRLRFSDLCENDAGIQRYLQGGAR